MHAFSHPLSQVYIAVGHNEYSSFKHQASKCVFLDHSSLLCSTGPRLKGCCVQNRQRKTEASIDPSESTHITTGTFRFDIAPPAIPTVQHSFIIGSLTLIKHKDMQEHKKQTQLIKKSHGEVKCLLVQSEDSQRSRRKREIWG